MIEMTLDREQRAIQEDFRALADGLLRPHAHEADRMAEVPELVSRSSQAIGTMHGFVPVRYGGGWVSNALGGETIDLASKAILRVLAAEQAARGDASLFIALPGPSLAACAVDALGACEQKESFYRLFLGTEPRWGAFAMSEPEAGSDVGALRTTATRRDGGHVLNGRKWFIGSGGRADITVVFATLNPALGQFGLRAFLAPKGLPGFRVARILPSMGLRALRLAELVFEDCFVPPGSLLLTPGKGGLRSGFHGGMRTFQLFRPMVAALGIGLGSECLDLALELERHAGTRTLRSSTGDSPRIRINEISVQLHAARMLCWKAAWLYDSGRDNSVESSMAKTMSAQAAMAAAVEYWHLASQADALAEPGVGKMLRDAKSIDLLEGTGDIQRLNVARGLVARLEAGESPGESETTVKLQEAMV